MHDPLKAPTPAFAAVLWSVILLGTLPGCTSSTASSTATSQLETDAAVESDALTAQEVMQVVTREKRSMAICIEEQRMRDPKLTGKLVMTWAVLPTGETADVGVSRHSPELEGTYIAGCIGGLIRNWRFPAHKGQTDPVIFPIKF